MSVKLSVIIVNYNTWALLRACLDALAASTLQPEIIVVDNDGSAHAVPDHYPDVVYLPQSHNRWFCGGNRIGVEAAQGEYVLLLNPDTVPQPDALQTLVDFMDTHADYSGATLQLRYPDGSLQRTCSRLPTFEYLLLNHTPLVFLLKNRTAQVNAHHWYAAWDRATSQDVEVMPGSCLLMRRADLRIDDRMRLYFPEDDLGRRFAGHKFRYLTGSFITHHEKSVTQSWGATQVYYDDLFVYTRKHHGLLPMLLLWLLSRPLFWGMKLKRLTLH
ncbi:MAG: hypothetical protein CL610_00290 [Anaerolineaceae bacterium]|nr:hypothetical protein [Anaerolineaceae bacterium]